jgi:predicted amidohydrolase
MICADGFATGQVVSRALALMGADVILSPSAWAVRADHDNTRNPYGQEWRDCYVPVAKEFGLWVVGVSNVGPLEAGPWEGRRCIGCSLVIGAGGREVVQGPYGEGAETILYVDVQPHRRTARGSGWGGA